eukprot:scaffold4827_cov109-Isochrysis_galbana.AAC.20
MIRTVITSPTRGQAGPGSTLQGGGASGDEAEEEARGWAAEGEAALSVTAPLLVLIGGGSAGPNHSAGVMRASRAMRAAGTLVAAELLIGADESAASAARESSAHGMHSWMPWRETLLTTARARALIGGGVGAGGSKRHGGSAGLKRFAAASQYSTEASCMWCCRSLASPAPPPPPPGGK